MIIFLFSSHANFDHIDIFISRTNEEILVIDANKPKHARIESIERILLIKALINTKH